MDHHPPPPQAHEREPTATPRPPERLALTLDLETYLGQLEDWDIPENQKTEFIKTFWELLVSIAQIGFEIHPAQLAQQSGRQKSAKPLENKGKTQEKAATPPPDLLYSKPYDRTQIIKPSNGVKPFEESEIQT